MTMLNDFLNRLKGQNTSASSPVIQKLSLNELDVLLAQRFSAENQLLQDPLMKKFSQIKFVLKSIQLQLKTLGDSSVFSEEGNQRLRKVVETTKFTFLRQMDGLTVRLFPPVSPSDFQSYALNAHAQLQKEIQFSGKNILYTGVVLKEEMKVLGELLQELEKHLLDIQKLYLMKPLLIEYSGLSAELSSIQKLVQEKKSIQQDQYDYQEKHKQLLQALSFVQAEITALRSSPEFARNSLLQIELENTTQQKKDVEQLCMNLFSPVDKAIGKLYSMVESKQFFLQDPEEVQVLLLLNSNPFLALKRDISGKKIKGILEDCLQLIRDGKLSFKEKEFDKKIESLKFLIEYDFYGQFFWKLNDIEKKEQDIKLEQSAFPAAAMDLNLNGRLMEIQKELNAVQAKMKELEAAVSSLSSTISIESSDLQNKLTKNLSDFIIITFE